MNLNSLMMTRLIKIKNYFSNFYLALIKHFLSHRLMRLLKMTSLLIESDQFLVDLLTTSIYISPYPEHSIYILKSHDKK